MKIKVGILGATGYTGHELVKLLKQRSDVELVWLSSENSAGKDFSDVFADLYQKKLISSEQALAEGAQQIDFCFSCLPHTLGIAAIKSLLEQNVRVIDLSADFRIKNAAEYQRWYQHEHQAQDLLQTAVYGLTEVNREQIKDAQLIANPGCYPTSVLLPLLPLLKNNILENNLIIDSKSSVSGAGRSAKVSNLFCEVSDNFFAYSIGYQHRHIAEMQQELEAVAAASVELIFSPHVIPINRGILSTIYVNLRQGAKVNDLFDVWQKAYQGERFVHPLGTKLPSIKHVAGTNQCCFAATATNNNQVIIVSVIDNLLKGAAGQAVQNFNLMAGVPEERGLI